jgi:hypothetical protein
MEKIDYLDFIKKFNETEENEAKINLVNQIIRTDLNLDIELRAVSLATDDLGNLDSLFNEIVAVTETYMKKSIIYFEALRNYTTLDVKDEYDGIENYNIQIEEILKNNIMIKRYYDTVNEIHNRKQLDIVKELSRSLKDIPSIEEVDKMTKDFSKIFNEDNKENLKTLQDISSFNDPAMKTLKDAIYSSIPQEDEGIVDKNK